jgi:hypothetical protein
VSEETERRVAEGARALAAALRAGDSGAVEALCLDEMWERAGRDDFAPLLEADEVEILGVLGRRSLLWLSFSERGAASCAEQLWHSGEPARIEDQRIFSLADRAAVEASGDSDRLARMRTKLESQDAAQRFVDALARRDLVAAGAFFEPTFAAQADLDLRERLPKVRDVELLAGVGPRTLVRFHTADGDLTVEYLWRKHDNVMLVAGARAFRVVE